MLIVTHHAALRWAQRFPDLDIQAEYERARGRVGKKIRKQIKQACPAHAPRMTRDNVDYFYAMTRDRIVFVVAPPDTLITVFRLDYPAAL